MLLEKQAKKEITKRSQDFFKSIKNELLGLTEEKHTKEQILNWGIFDRLFNKKKENLMEWTNTKILRELKKRMKVEDEKELQQAEKKIKSIKAVEVGKIDITCKIEWYYNRTWGNCPKGEYWGGNGYQYIGGITGCGYDKQSTWTAKAFNKDVILKSYIYKYCEKHNINKDNIRKKLGYGLSMWNGMPEFDGGVGLSSHINILKNLGFRVESNGGRTWDYLHITSKK